MSAGGDHLVLRLRADAVAWRAVGDEVVALDVTHASYLAVNRTGAVLWEALAHGATRDGLVELLQDRFGIDRTRAAGSVERFLCDLRDRQLLEDP
jgi:hypothetical protein